MGRGADLLGQLDLDEGLEDALHAQSNEIDVAALSDRVEQRVGVKLFLGHRW